MDEPLLGSRRKSSFFLNPALFHIPEDEPADVSNTPPLACDSPSSFKEKLIFGSPEVSPRSRFILINGARLSDDRGADSSGQLRIKSGKFVSRSFSNAGRNEDFENLESGEGAGRSYDDSVVDYGVYWRNSDTYEDDQLRPEGSRLWAWSPENLKLHAESTPIEHKKAGVGSEEQSSVVNLPEEALPRGSDSAKCKKYLHRSRTAPAMAVMDGMSKAALNLRTPPESSTSVVKQAFVGLMLYLVVGVLIYVWNKEDFSGISTDGFIDALYFCIVTMCTIGYGDITPCTPSAKLFSCVFVLVGFGFIDILLSGMVTYVLDRQETFLLGTVAGGRHEIASHYVVDVKKGRMRIRLKVALAFGVVILSIGLGTIVMHYLENLVWLDAFYLSCMSVTTVGYGDHAFKTLQGRLFASVWLLVSTLAVARAFLYLAEARIDKRHRLIAKRILQKEMTVGDLVAADLDNDNCVSKSDFVVYKLKQMGKIEEKDILEVCGQFNRLDTENSGKITLSCLINHHEEALSVNT